MVTIRDVAIKAEVSIATVSRVVNGNRPVQPEIRDRVLKAIEELDYRPNYLARGLRQHTTSMIGLLIPDNSNPFYAEAARAIEDAGFAAGYGVILCNWDLSEEKLKAYLDVLTGNIPVVLANAELLTSTIDQVMADGYQGGYAAGQYLLRLNHRCIGCIDVSSSFTRETSRMVGFRQALSEKGIEQTADHLAFGNGRYDSGYKAMQELYQRCPDLTAVFVFNDLMALGAMNALRTLGIRVPEDLSIIGFDNIFYDSTSEPTLTTIAQPIAAIGQECIAQLLERMHLPAKEPVKSILPVELIERASCRRLPVT
jgi:LacI family transcriptional regulator